MKYDLKNVLMILGVLSLSACGLFSNDKDLPKGERLSVLSTTESTSLKNATSPIVEVGKPVLQNMWAQAGGNETHIVGNIDFSLQNMKLSKKISFGEGSSKHKLLLAQPVSDGRFVFIQDVLGVVSAFDLQTGQRVWKHKIKPQIKNESEAGVNGVGLAMNDKAVFALAGFGSVVALDRETGNELWRQEMNTPLRTAPTLCENTLLVQTLDNRLSAYQVTDGQELWQYKMPAEDTVLAGGASVACNQKQKSAVAGFSNGELQAFTLRAGYPLWSVSILNRMTVNSVTGINALKASPVVDGERAYAIGHNDSLTAIDLRSGEKVWERRLGGTNMPWFASGKLFVLTNDNQLSAIDALNGGTYWQTSLLEEYDVKKRSGIYLSGPVMLNGELLVTASNGNLYRISIADGQIKDRVETGYNFSASPIVAGSYLIFVTDDARLIIYE